MAGLATHLAIGKAEFLRSRLQELDAFRRELPEPNLTVNVGLMLGGTPATLDPGGARGSAAGKTNIVAAEAVARGDMRTFSAAQEARARAKMQAIVDAHLPKTDATLAFDDSYPAMAPTARFL